MGTRRPSAKPLLSRSISAPAPASAAEAEPAPTEVYSDMLAKRPALLDEKLKVHERIIDEFNLAALEKLPPEEIAKQIRAYVGNYARTESLSLNQKELDIFARRSWRK